MRRFLEIGNKHLGKDHISNATSLENFSWVLEDMGLYIKSEESL